MVGLFESWHNVAIRQCQEIGNARNVCPAVVVYPGPCDFRAESEFSRLRCKRDLVPLEEQIIEWSASRPAWQRSVLRRVATGDVLSATDYKKLVESLLVLRRGANTLTAIFAGITPGSETARVISRHVLAFRLSGCRALLRSFREECDYFSERYGLHRLTVKITLNPSRATFPPNRSAAQEHGSPHATVRTAPGLLCRPPGWRDQSPVDSFALEPKLALGGTLILSNL